MNGEGMTTPITIPCTLVGLADGQYIKSFYDTIKIVSTREYDTKNLFKNEQPVVINLAPHDVEFMSRDHVMEWISQEVGKHGK